MLQRELLEGVSAAFTPEPPRVDVGSDVRAASSRDPYNAVASLETRVGAETLSLVAMIEGRGGTEMADYCERTLLQQIVRNILKTVKDEGAAQGPSGRSIQRAVCDAFRSAHDAARDVAAAGHSGCTATVCVVNRHRREVTTCNVGNLTAIMVTKGRILTLSTDHSLASAPSERQRVTALGTTLGHAQDKHGRPTGPLRAWPSGLTSARGIGFLGAGEIIEPTPSCSTVALPLCAGSEVVVGSRGVWDELLSSVVAGIVRATPVASAAASLVVDRAATQSKTFKEDDLTSYNQPSSDTACAILSLGSLGGDVNSKGPFGGRRIMTYNEARVANTISPQAPRRMLQQAASQRPKAKGEGGVGGGPSSGPTPLITPGLTPLASPGLTPGVLTPANSNSPRSNASSGKASPPPELVVGHPEHSSPKMLLPPSLLQQKLSGGSGEDHLHHGPSSPKELLPRAIGSHRTTHNGNRMSTSPKQIRADVPMNLSNDLRIHSPRPSTPSAPAAAPAATTTAAKADAISASPKAPPPPLVAPQPVSLTAIAVHESLLGMPRTPELSRSARVSKDLSDKEKEEKPWWAKLFFGAK